MCPVHARGRVLASSPSSSSWSSKCRYAARGFHHFFVGVTALLFSFRLTFRRCARGGGEKMRPPNTIDRYGQRTSVGGRGCDARVCLRVCVKHQAAALCTCTMHRRRQREREREERRWLDRESERNCKNSGGRTAEKEGALVSVVRVPFLPRYCRQMEIVIRYSLLVPRRVL